MLNPIRTLQPVQFLWSLPTQFQGQHFHELIENNNKFYVKTYLFLNYLFLSSSNTQFKHLLQESIKRFFFDQIISDEIFPSISNISYPKLNEKYAFGDESWNFDN